MDPNSKSRPTPRALRQSQWRPRQVVTSGLGLGVGGSHSHTAADTQTPPQADQAFRAQRKAGMRNQMDQNVSQMSFHNHHPGLWCGVSSMNGSASAPLGRRGVPSPLPSPCTSVQTEVAHGQPVLQLEQRQLLQNGPLQLGQALQGHGLHPRAGAWHRGRAKGPLENTPV